MAVVGEVVSLLWELGGPCFSILVVKQPVKNEMGPFSGLLECRMGSLLQKEQGPCPYFVMISVVGSQLSL